MHFSYKLSRFTNKTHVNHQISGAESYLLDYPCGKNRTNFIAIQKGMEVFLDIVPIACYFLREDGRTGFNSRNW